MGMMLDYIGEAAMLEQLAEEAAELAQASLKKARVLRKENPTPKTLEEVNASLQEELTDVVHCSFELGLVPDITQIYSKSRRFAERMIAADKERIEREQALIRGAAQDERF